MNEDASLESLIEILRNPEADTSDRLDACHALARIPGEACIKALIETLVDREFGVRWAASEALCQHGHEAVEPLLRELETHPADQRLYESAHHVLNTCTEPATRAIVQPVIDALEQSAGSEIAVPVASFQALGELRQFSP